jgi:hypothetical protein
MGGGVAMAVEIRGCKGSKGGEMTIQTANKILAATANELMRHMFLISKVLRRPKTIKLLDFDVESLEEDVERIEYCLKEFLYMYRPFVMPPERRQQIQLTNDYNSLLLCCSDTIKLLRMRALQYVDRRYLELKKGGVKNHASQPSCNIQTKQISHSRAGGESVCGVVKKYRQENAV